MVQSRLESDTANCKDQKIIKISHFDLENTHTTHEFGEHSPLRNRIFWNPTAAEMFTQGSRFRGCQMEMYSIDTMVRSQRPLYFTDHPCGTMVREGDSDASGYLRKKDRSYISDF